ncbi:uncharacterized protein LOC119584197 isoform X2 [Penaeus monodon]|uniref:uncharacterized protein LOC119584197 isoform X2 n=1 Tax=Penaeus monodon TaxID=6687 RepID=UPI0018A7DA20|nr:uncharacterized protein LOC119584197 isoform X2 [Penaeus monodon]
MCFALDDPAELGWRPPSLVSVLLGSGRSFCDIPNILVRSLGAIMKTLIAILATAMLAGPIYSQNWEVIMKHKRVNPLLAVLSGFSRRMAISKNGDFLFQNIQHGGGPQTQDVLQESSNNDTVHQEVMQNPSLHIGRNGAKSLQSQQVHQHATGHYVVQNVVQGPSIHIPNFKLPDVHVNTHHSKCSD